MHPMLEGVDVPATITSIVIGAGGIGAVVAGIRAGLKKVRSETDDAGTRFAGGVIMENSTMTMLSERLRENSEAVRENTAAERETAHQIERLRDKL